MMVGEPRGHCPPYLYLAVPCPMLSTHAAGCALYGPPRLVLVTEPLTQGRHTCWVHVQIFHDLECMVMALLVAGPLPTCN